MRTETIKPAQQKKTQLQRCPGDSEKAQVDPGGK